MKLNTFTLLKLIRKSANKDLDIEQLAKLVNLPNHRIDELIFVLRNLSQIGYIDMTLNYSGISITGDGFVFLNNHEIETQRYNWSLGLSIIAIVISVVALLAQYLNA